MVSPEALRHWTPPIAALLRGDVPDVVRGAGPEEVSALADACIVHGVHGVLYHQLVGARERWGALPQGLRERLEGQAKTDLMWELAHKAELRAALSALSRAGVAVLVMKGTSLAYALYHVPSIRSRGDTDLLVREEDVSALCDVLADLGYVRDTESQGIGCEVNLTKKDRSGFEHVLDVHWRLSSNEAFVGLCDWEEASRESITLPKLAPQARGLGYVHALSLACVHRAVHFHMPYYVNGDAFLEGNRVIWLYDIKLLAGAFEAADWSSFVETARDRGVGALCLDALRTTQELLGATVSAEACAALARPVRTELSAQLLSASAWRSVWVEFWAQRGLGARLRFLRELVFPELEYMRRKFPGQRAWLLPYLYVRRVFEGAQKRMKHFR